MYLIDSYAHLNRWSCRNPLEKLALSGGMLLLSLILPAFPGPLLVFVAAAMLTLRGAGIPLGFYLKLLLAPTGFALTSAAALAVSVAAGPGVAWHVGLSAAGAMTACRLLLRALGAVSSLYLLALTTPMMDLLTALRRWGLPAFLLDIMLLTYRFLFVLSDTAHTAMAAQASRLGYSRPGLGRRSLALLTASLLRRLLARARRLEYGLAARGYDGNLSVLTVERPVSLGGLVRTAALISAVAGFGYYLGRLWTCPR